MKLYTKYIIKNLFRPFFLSMSILIVLIWSSRITNYLDYMIQSNSNILIFFKFTLVILPSVIIIISPISLSLSTIISYNKLIENRELIIFKSSGLKKKDLLFPIFILSIIITIFVYSCSLYFAPKLKIFSENAKEDIKNNISSSLFKEKVFTNFDDFVIYANKKEENTLKGILIYKLPKKNIFEVKIKNYEKMGNRIVIQAEKMEIYDDYAVLYNGNYQMFDIKKKIPNIFFFDRYTFDLNSLVKEKSTLNTDPAQMLSLVRLYFFFYLPNSGIKKKGIYELFYRIFSPLLCMIIPILSGAIILNNSFNRISNMKSILKSTIVSLISYVIIIFSLKKIKDNLLYIHILFIFLIIIISYIIYLLKERKKI